MKSLLQKWEEDYTDDQSLSLQIQSWLNHRTNFVKSKNASSEFNACFLSELCVRALEEYPQFAGRILDVVFNDFSIEKHAPTHVIAQAVFARCGSDNDWSPISPILSAMCRDKMVNVNQYHNSWRETLTNLANLMMRGPDFFTRIGEHFDDQAKIIMVPYCLACDPYNVEFIEQNWSIQIDFNNVFDSMIINTQGLVNFENIDDIKPLSPLITVSEVLDKIENLPKTASEEFIVLSKLIKDANNGKNVIVDLSRSSWALIHYPDIMLNKWLKLLEFANDQIAPSHHYQYLFEKMDEISQQYDISFAEFGRRIQKSVLKNEIDDVFQTRRNPVQRKI